MFKSRIVLFSITACLILASCKTGKIVSNIDNNNSSPISITEVPAPEKNINILFPNSWINKLCNSDNSSNAAEIVTEFIEIIKPLELDNEEYNYEKEGYFINKILADIDSDREYEILALIGRTRYYPALCVFKKINNKWYLLYLDSFHVHYSQPELYIANSFSLNKTFYIRKLQGRGSGIFQDAYHFYKLIDNKVYPCLTLLNECRLYGWGQYLNQDIKTSFKINSSDVDEIWVVYDYSFFPGPVYEDNVDWESNPDTPFVKGKGDISYKWDDTTLEYRPHYYTSNSRYLTEKKIACFDDFANDKLFIEAFDYEINETLKNGTDKQKSILRWYLDVINNE